MQTKEAIKSRYSCREFSSKPIPEELIQTLVDSARLAPTARNVQPWEFIAITNKDTLNNIAALASNGPFIATCACCIVVVCKDTKYYLEDGCAATENILLMACDLGLAACWVAGDKKPYCDDVKKMLNVPQDFKVISLIALGFAKEATPKLHTKRPLEQILHWETYK